MSVLREKFDFLILQSSRLGIYTVKILSLSSQKSWPITEIICKAFGIPYSSINDFAIFPLMRRLILAIWHVATWWQRLNSSRGMETKDGRQRYESHN
jgi:hypothetical protein